MISKRDIGKIAKRVLRRQGGLRDHQIIHPRRDWLIGLLGGIALLVAGGSWSVTTYRDVSDREVENAETAEVQQTVYNDDMVNTALSELSERKETYQKMIDAKGTIQIPVEDVVEEIEPDPEPEVTEDVSEEEVVATPGSSAPDEEPTEGEIDIN